MPDGAGWLADVIGHLNAFTADGGRISVDRDDDDAPPTLAELQERYGTCTPEDSARLAASWREYEADLGVADHD